LSRDERSQYGEDDFGDFEEGKTYTNISRSPSIDDRVPISDEREKRGDDVGPLPKDAPVSEAQHPDITSPHDEIKDHGPIVFDVDLSALDQVFPTEVEPGNATDSSLSDVESVIHDLFSSVEQRKTWYRISRYGTMRKHNTGDDDNYVRINWANSSIRDETLKVVSRWMMEDRVRGGISFGGSNKLGGLFGWGQPAETAVQFPSTQMLDMKRKDTKGSHASIENPIQGPDKIIGHERRRSTLDSKGVARKSMDAAPVPAPHFSWSTTQPAPHNGVDNQSVLSPDTDHPPEPFDTDPSKQRPSPLPHPIQDIDSGAKKPLNTRTIKRSTAVELPPALQPISIQSNGPSSNNNQVDDDDWGEMVASPVTTAPPALQEMNHGHRSTQSLMNVLSPQLGGSHLPSTAHHKSTMSETIPGFHNNGTNNTPLTPDSLMSAPKAEALSVSSIDPWATADFSFFESSSAPSPKSSEKLSQPFSRSVPHPRQKSKAEVEEQNLVNEIIRNLPDLSYMLRR